MHVDSRNPQRYTFEMYTGIQEPWHVYSKVDDSGDYVKFSDYQNLKGKLENLERKYAKLKKRSAKLGAIAILYSKLKSALQSPTANGSMEGYDSGPFYGIEGEQ